MSRPLRIQYPGAWYHVMNRGRRFENVFEDGQDYRVFVDILKDTSEMWHVKIAAYCLMPNHYHMLLQTPKGNIARAMRHIDGVYTQRYNKKHGQDGQLFRGRYKSILVDGDSYLLEIVRYIHRNPVKAGLVTALTHYEWSSHKGYLSVSKKWDWLYKDLIYRVLSQNKEEWVKRYRQFVSIKDDDEATHVLEGKRWPSVWGPPGFLDWIKGRYYESKADDEVPQSRVLDPGHEEILRSVCKYYAVDENALYRAKRGATNEPRNVSIYLIRRLRRDTLKEIGRQFKIDKYSSVSSIIERVKRQMQEDAGFRKRIDELSSTLTKSQGQT